VQELHVAPGGVRTPWRHRLRSTTEFVEWPVDSCLTSSFSSTWIRGGRLYTVDYSRNAATTHCPRGSLACPFTSRPASFQCFAHCSHLQIALLSRPRPQDAESGRRAKRWRMGKAPLAAELWVRFATDPRCASAAILRRRRPYCAACDHEHLADRFGFGDQSVGRRCGRSATPSTATATPATPRGRNPIVST
jgi:hypothetical protein